MMWLGWLLVLGCNCYEQSKQFGRDRSQRVVGRYRFPTDGFRPILVGINECENVRFVREDVALLR